MSRMDVVIVGGGPAGASTAFQLARAGARVRVLERFRFPRAKPCAECLSPEASRILADMNVLGELERQGALLRGMLVRAPDGRVARGDYVASHGFRGYSDRGLAIRRELLDAALLRRAREAGADVRERVRVVDLLRDTDGSVRGVRVLDGRGRTFAIRASYVVGADGLRSVVSRRLRLARTAVWPRRLALIGHYAGVADVGEYVEMHVERDGFVGIADVGRGLTTVAAVFPQRRAKEIAADRATFLDAWVASKPHLAQRFATASREGGVVATGPFASRARRAWQRGAILVGDAADFFDPFTGEGIYAALRGGELAAAALAQAMNAADDATELRALRAYESARRTEFGGKWWVERLVGMGVAIPPVVNHAVRTLSLDKPLADLLVGVTGDFVPPREVLNATYLARLFLVPPRRRELAQC